MVQLPPYVWRSVRYALSYQVERLERKAERTASAGSADRDRERAENLSVAISAIDEELDRIFQEEGAG